MSNFNVQTLLFLQALVFAAAAGTKGSSNNQWNQESPQQRWPQTKGAPLGGWDDEVTNPQGRVPDGGWKLEDSVPGVPGQSYPNYGKIPVTSFDCRKQVGPGYYADTEAQCQVFHICQADGRQNSFLCSTGTIFNQETFVCDWWFNVNCEDTSMYYVRNGNLYRSPYIGIDGSKVNGYTQRGQESGGNAQQPAVGIPGFEAGSRGQNWQPQAKSQSRGQWAPNQGGSQKGDSRPVNQGRMGGGGQRWQNRGPANPNVRQGAGRSQKGSRGMQNINQQQHGAIPNQKGGGFQRPMANTNQGWGQKGTMRGGIQNPQGQGINQQRGMNKGGVNQRHPNAQLDGDVSHGNRGGTHRNGRVNSNKGSDTNAWSIRAQNFETTSQDRKGSGSDAWPNNHNANAGPDTAMSPYHSSWRDQRRTAGHSENQEMNYSWNSDVQKVSQWEENNAQRDNYEQGQWRNSNENHYDYA